MSSPAPAIRLLPATPSEPPWEPDPAPAAPPSAPPAPPPAPPTRCPGTSTADCAPSGSVHAVRALLGAVLECVDGRRALPTLAARLEAAPRAVVRDLARGAAGPSRTPAVLRTVHLSRAYPAAVQGPDTPQGHTPVFEVCATYARGRRLFAIAARVGYDAGGAMRLLALRMLA